MLTINRHKNRANNLPLIKVGARFTNEIHDFIITGVDEWDDTSHTPKSASVKMYDHESGRYVGMCIKLVREIAADLRHIV